MQDAEITVDARTLVEKASDTVLATCQSVHEAAYISSIFRDRDGRTCVRVRASAGGDPGVPDKMKRTMHAKWPLAATAIVESPIDGVIETHVVVPTAHDEYRRAKRVAATSRLLVAMRMAQMAFAFAGVVLYCTQCMSWRHAQ